MRRLKSWVRIILGMTLLALILTIFFVLVFVITDLPLKQPMIPPNDNPCVSLKLESYHYDCVYTKNLNEQYNTTDFPNPYQVKCKATSQRVPQGYTCSIHWINPELNDYYVCNGESIKKAFEYCKTIIQEHEPNIKIISPKYCWNETTIIGKKLINETTITCNKTISFYHHNMIYSDDLCYNKDYQEKYPCDAILCIFSGEEKTTEIRTIEIRDLRFTEIQEH